LESSDAPNRRDRPQRHLEAIDATRRGSGRRSTVGPRTERPWRQSTISQTAGKRGSSRPGSRRPGSRRPGSRRPGSRRSGSRRSGSRRSESSRPESSRPGSRRSGSRKPRVAQTTVAAADAKVILQLGIRRGAESSYDYREILRCLHLHTGSDRGAGSWRPGPARSASSRSRRQRRLRAWPGAAKSRPSRAETRGQRTWQSGPAAFPRRCRGGRGGRGDASKPKTQANRRRKQTGDASKPKTQTNRRRKAIRKHPELQEVPQGNGHTAGKSTARRRQDPADDGVGRNRSPGRDSSYSCENRAGRCAASRGALESVRSRSWLRRS
jgi:hypothetical protein